MRTSNRFVSVLLVGLMVVTGCSKTVQQPQLNYPGVSPPSIDRNYYTNIRQLVPDPPSVVLINPSTTARIVPLYLGQPSPFTGVLFNNEAAATVQVRFTTQATECVINRRSDLERLAVRALTDIDLYQAALIEQHQQGQVLLRGRDEEIERLISGNSSSNLLNYTLIGTAGLVVGFGLFGSIYTLTR